MNVLYISREYPPETAWGGIATYTADLAEKLADKGHNVTVLAYSPDKEKDELQNNVHVIRTSFLYLYKLYPIRIFSLVRRIVRKQAIDVIEVPEHGAEALVYQRMREKPIVVRLHGPTSYWDSKLTPFQKILDYAEKIQTKEADSITSPSRTLARDVCRRWKLDIRQVKVIPNGINLRKLEETASKYKPTKIGSKYILFFGRLEERKGPHLLADSLPEVFEKIPCLKAVFVGKNGSYQDTTMAHYIITRNWKYRERLVFTGYIPRSDLISIICNSELVVLPSLREPFGYTILESMSLGKCVVASSCGAFQELIEDGRSGFLVKINPKELAEKIIYCLSEVDLQKIGEKAAKKARRFDINSIAERTIKNYAKTIREFQQKR